MWWRLLGWGTQLWARLKQSDPAHCRRCGWVFSLVPAQPLQVVVLGGNFLMPVVCVLCWRQATANELLALHTAHALMLRLRAERGVYQGMVPSIDAVIAACDTASDVSS